MNDWCISVLQHPMNTEEANLLYVAVTRAKRALIMSKTIRMILSTMGVSHCVSELYSVPWGEFLCVILTHCDHVRDRQNCTEHHGCELICALWTMPTVLCVSGWISSPVCVFQGGCHHPCVCFRVDVITRVCVSGWMSSPMCVCFRVDVITHVCVFQGGCHHPCVSGWMSSPVCVFQGGCHHPCVCFRVDVITHVCVSGGCHHPCVCVSG